MDPAVLLALALVGLLHDAVHHLHITQVAWRASSSKVIPVDGRAFIIFSLVTLICCWLRRTTTRTWSSILPPTSQRSTQDLVTYCLLRVRRQKILHSTVDRVGLVRVLMERTLAAR
jgi:hypothetical protein